MRFCMVTTFYPPYHFGGDAVFVHSLAQELAKRGHSVDVVHCEDAYRLKRNNSVSLAPHPGITVHRLRSRFGKLSPLITQQTGGPGLKARKLRAIFRENFDVVNFHNISLIGGPAILSMSRAPVNIYTLHEHWLLCPTHVFWKNRKQPCDSPECVRCSIRSGIPPQLWRYTGLSHRNVARLDALIAPSRYTARVHQAAGFSAPVHVLPSFSPLNPSPPAEYSSQLERPRFAYVGRIAASKGIATLVKDFSSWKDYDLWIAGEGDLLPQLRRDYQDCPNIRFLGYVEPHKLAPLLQECTALILPAIGPEAFPLCVLEAFACSIPAIVRDAGGSREAIDRTGAGFVYDTGEELLSHIGTLVSNPEILRKMKNLARQGYEKYYTADRYVDAYLELIQSKWKGKTQELKAAKSI